MVAKNRFKSQIEKDICDLNRLGYAQELYRTIGGFSNFSITFSVISILSGLLFLYSDGQGPAGNWNIWVWVMVCVFQIILALALGEIASIYPLAGGVYKWTERLSNNQSIGWVCGYFSIIGWIACTAGIEFGMGTFLAFYLGLDKTPWMILGMTGIIILLHSSINIYGIRIVAWFNDFSVNVHIMGVVILVSLLLIFGQRNSLRSVFSIKHSLNGSIVANFAQPLLMSAWTLMAFDASASVSEESINPSKVVPWGMFYAVVMSALLGVILLVSLNLALPDLKQPIDNNMPFSLYVIQQAIGHTMFEFIMSFILMAQFAAGLSSQTVLIRILYSFSRDQGLPLSKTWRRVSSRYDTPIYSVFLAATLTFILILLTRNLYFIASLSTMGIYSSYVITLGTAIWGHRKIKENYGSFYLGKLGGSIRLISFLWALFIVGFIILFFFGKAGRLPWF
ncbi:amino acid permease [Desulfosporosinus fructosivorans]|uniref:Amino acid permease n=1 Tax=Desulfosporosinus fructosivorans TaxID=2018669 RepID=A0A4Z0QX05_9FIRM|nr:amino acid permease [Desulfosporosinus fructosivorans]TGE35048.1 amino acid permease [Desulfosporosinus fructosivorans]